MRVKNCWFNFPFGNRKYCFYDTTVFSRKRRMKSTLPESLGSLLKVCRMWITCGQMCSGWQGVVRGQCYRARLRSNGIFCCVCLWAQSELKVFLKSIEKKKKSWTHWGLYCGKQYLHEASVENNVFRNVVKVTWVFLGSDCRISVLINIIKTTCLTK